MPERDSYGRLGGFLEIEDHEYSDAWRKRFVLLDEATLKFYPGKDTMQVGQRSGLSLPNYSLLWFIVVRLNQIKNMYVCNLVMLRLISFFCL